jgi:diguanylate cyclase (GGDEF)-like protein
MMAEISAITNSTRIGDMFAVDHFNGLFESDVIVQNVLEFFSTCDTDAVIITHDSLPVGIVTLRNIVQKLYNCDTLGISVSELMSSPLHSFDHAMTIAEVVDLMKDVEYNKIVVTKENNTVVGIIDRHHLLSMCYSHLTPIIKHEYNMIHSLMELVGEGNRGLLEMATTDTLTGIGNRRLLEEVFQAHQNLGERYDVKIFLLLFDIDNFKSINDTFGHNVGDLVLKQLAALVSQSIRKTDVFARWGGEEFAVLLRYSNPMAVMKVAEQIRKRIDNYSFETIVHVTCSFGLTSVHPEDSLEVVIERADKALYRAKADGKNVVRMEIV